MFSGKSGAYLSAILAMTLWGFTFVFFKIAAVSFRPMTIVFQRLFISIFFLFGFAFPAGRLKRIKAADQPWFILMAFFEPFMYFLGEANGLSRVSATVAAVIISTIPLLVPFVARLLFGERLTLLNKLGLVVSFMGVLMVVMVGRGELSADYKGILLLLLAVVSAVGYTMVVRRLVDDYPPMTITAYQSLYGLLLFLPIFLIWEWPHFDPHAITRDSLLSLLFLGIFGSGICFILMAVSIRELGAARSNVFANIVPVVTAIVSFFLLGEAMPLLKILGIALTVLGLFLSQISSLKGIRPGRKELLRHPPYS
ncbi:MAG: EamA family transporter [Bacteroidetes bacterium]|nr:MAG: EamA family transporter [Bacteroidota bacterium]